MLGPLLRNGTLEVWDDTRIQPGDLSRQDIAQALASAKVAVLLVSANFLNSKFIADNELPPLLAAARDGGVTIYWIYVSAALYKHTEIAQFQAAHDTKRALDQMSRPQRQAVLSEICAKLRTLIG